MFCSLPLNAQYWFRSGEMLAQCHRPSMSSSVVTAVGTQLKVTPQQKPVEPMGSETPLATASSVAAPPEPDGVRPLLGSRIVAVGRPTPDGSSVNRKLTVEPGPRPYGMKPP